MNPSECPICTNPYTDDRGDYIPKILPCGHTFCSMCLFSIYHNYYINCPQCRLSHYIIDYNLIPKNYTVMELLSFYLQRNNQHSEKTISIGSNNSNSHSVSNNSDDIRNNDDDENIVDSLSIPVEFVQENERSRGVSAAVQCQDGQIVHEDNNYEDIILQRTKPLEDLTIDEVSSLLISLKLSKFVNTFHENDIDGLTLSHCRSEDDLAEAGINIRVKARYFYEKIQFYQIHGVPLCDIQSNTSSSGTSSGTSLSINNVHNEEEISLWIIGMTGIYEFMNGLYYPTNEIYMGRRRYFKLQYDCWIEYNSDYHQWHIKPNNKKTTTNAWAYITSLPSIIYPYESNSSWYLYDGTSFIKSENVYCFPHYSIHLAGIPIDNSYTMLPISLNGYYEPVPNDVYNGICRYRQKSFGYSSTGRYWMEYSLQYKQWQLKSENDLGTNNYLLYILCSHPKDLWSNIFQWVLSSSVLSSHQSFSSSTSTSSGITSTSTVSLPPDILSFPKLYGLEISGGNGPTAAHIRGIYQPSNEIYGGWVRYKKVTDHNCWLEKMESQKQWHIKPTKDKCLTNAWACVKYTDNGPPYLVEDGWLVFDGRVFNLDSDLKCIKKLPLI